MPTLSARPTSSLFAILLGTNSFLLACPSVLLSLSLFLSFPSLALCSGFLAWLGSLTTSFDISYGSGRAGGYAATDVVSLGGETVSTQKIGALIGPSLGFLFLVVWLSGMKGELVERKG